MALDMIAERVPEFALLDVDWCGSRL